VTWGVIPCAKKILSFFEIRTKENLGSFFLMKGQIFFLVEIQNTCKKKKKIHVKVPSLPDDIVTVHVSSKHRSRFAGLSLVMVTTAGLLKRCPGGYKQTNKQNYNAGWGNFKIFFSRTITLQINPSNLHESFLKQYSFKFVQFLVPGVVGATKRKQSAQYPKLVKLMTPLRRRMKRENNILMRPDTNIL
jgi:hypothetical protein